MTNMQTEHVQAVGGPAASSEKVTAFAWLKDLTPSESRSMKACFGGWALDSFDLQLFSLVIPTLITVWGISRAEAGLLGTSALLLSAVGGWIAGILCDRYGRVRILQVTIVWFAVFTFLSGFTQNFSQLFFCRAMQGLGFGGEWAAGSILVAEAIRSKYRGRAVGFVQSGWSFGWAAGVLLYTAFYYYLPESTAWRALFWTGIIPALFVVYIRRNVTEPEIFQRTAKQKTSGWSQLSRLFAGDIRRRILLASLLTTGIQGAYYAIVTWLPTFLKTERNLSVLNTGSYLAVVILGNFAGFMIGAFLTDRIGRKPTFFAFAVFGVAVAYSYTMLPIDNSWMLLLGFPLGICSSGMYAPIGSFLSELFPTEIRGAAQGFSYNFGRAVGALFPTFIGVLSTTMPLSQAIGTFTLVAYAFVFIALLFLPETKGRDLV